MNRRKFLLRTAIMTGGMAATFGAGAADEEMIDLGFENGKRPLVEYPQKRPLIRVTTRPPQLETPFSVFNNGPITPNDAFFVRYHLTQSPPPETLLRPDRFRLNLTGNVKDALTFSMEDLRRFEPVQVTAVNQCSGNSRGFFKPRVAGGQMGNGAMGNAVWKGARLKDVLAKAGVGATAKQVMFNGLDQAILPQTPDFVKALDIDQAMDGETMLAYEMNGEALPWLNGYPLRLVVPGHYGTYWVKHLHEIKVIDEVFNGFWMNPGYRIPDNSCGCVEPGVKPAKTIPISRFNVRSFLTSLKDGDKLKSKQAITLRGIAFDGGYGITEVAVSDDEGKNWRTAQLGKDLGKYSFREWTLQYVPTAGNITLRVKATNRTGQSQPMEPLWNPSGYMRNVVETITVSAG